MAIGESRFYTWLLTQRHSDLRHLQDYAKSRSDWKKVADFQDAWVLINANDQATDTEKKRLIETTVLAFQSFDAAQPPDYVQSKMPTAFGLGVFFFMGTILAILFLAIFEPTFYPSNFDGQSIEPLLARLANLETSRGLITFVFTVGVIALALIIVTANVMTGDKEGSRFERSKEILTSLIAILGTILGFYFGKADGADIAQPEPATSEQTVEENPEATSPQGGEETPAEIDPT